MNPDRFRALALALPESVEGSHQGHADFRVRRRIFATLGWPDPAWAVVKLAPEEQALLVEAEPEVFVPVRGAWGRAGNTQLRLAAADEATAASALRMAWLGTAPKSLHARLGADQA